MTDVSVDLLLVMDDRVRFRDETLAHHLLLLHVKVVKINIVLGVLVRRLMGKVALIVWERRVSNIVSSLHVEDFAIDSSTIVVVMNGSKVGLV